MYNNNNCKTKKNYTNKNWHQTQEFGQNMVRIWSEWGRNMVGIWSEYGRKWSKNTSFFNSDSTWNDSEKLGMAKNLSLNFFYFFTRNEVGIWSDSYHSAQIHSECVGEGKVLSSGGKSGSTFGHWIGDLSSGTFWVGSRFMVCYQGYQLPLYWLSEVCVFRLRVVHSSVINFETVSQLVRIILVLFGSFLCYLLVRLIVFRVLVCTNLFLRWMLEMVQVLLVRWVRLW